MSGHRGRVKSRGLHAPRPFAPRRAYSREMKTFLGHPGGAQKVYDPNGTDRLPQASITLSDKTPKNTSRAHTPAPARGESTVRQLAPLHRKAVNQAAHAAALRFEIELRERWTKELTDALEAGASFQDVQKKIATLATRQRH